jgi:very-short-patch-repair endonuclease
MILPETGRGTAPERRGGGGSSPRQRPEIYQARKLRREMSLPEAMLWKRLRRGSIGAKFRRQHPIGPYVADFCCLEARLVVEVDGEVHGADIRQQRDAARDDFMVEKGSKFCAWQLSMCFATPTAWLRESPSGWPTPTTIRRMVPHPVPGRIYDGRLPSGAVVGRNPGPNAG